MGFFSSIGKAFNKVVDVGKDIVGGVVDSVIKDPISAAGTVLNGVGGILGMNSQSDANAANAALAQQQFEWQKAYAQNRLQWQVEDAKKAGLHPMVAAGLSPVSFSPVSSSQQGVNYDWVGDLGQNLAYAATKAKTNKQQEQAFDLAQATGSEQLRGVQLDNELKMLEIMSLASRLTQTGPAAPNLNGGHTLLPGQNDSPFIDKPIVRDGWLLDEKGRKVGIIPSEDAASRFEDKLIVEWVPFAGSAVRGFKGKFLGQKVNGHWWHGDDKGFLPYPPKKGKGFASHVSDVLDFYRDYDG